MTETWKIYRALDLISRIKKEETHEKYIDRHNAFDIAIESMEKQIPKKPIVDEEMKAIEVYYWNCPSCNTRYGTGTDMIELQHCHVCGQKIDWEEGGTSD